MPSWNEIRKPDYLKAIKPLPDYICRAMIGKGRVRSDRYKAELADRLAKIRAARPPHVWEMVDDHILKT